MSISYEHSFDLAGQPVVSATLTLFTLGVQDGDTQVSGSNTDIRLFLDNVELPGAFDSVDQFTFDGLEFVETAGTVSLTIPDSHFGLLSDGVLEVTILVLQLGTAPSTDAIAIDYSELLIEPLIETQATDARLNFPTGMGVDASGDLFIADFRNSRVRRVDGATGVITTVAGTGISGFSGDGGPATDAQLNEPFGVAVDASGDLFIADTSNDRVRRVDAATGVITTVVGTGISGFSGDGGPTTDAQLNEPFGVAVDASGDLFIADTSNDRVRRVDAATGVITTVAGTGISGFSGDGGPATDAQLNEPFGVAVDASGDLFIADTSNDRVRRVDAATGVITTVAGTGISGFSGDGGQATDAQLNDPSGVAVDASGNLFIADTSNDRVRRVDSATGVITSVAGTGISGFSGDGGPATDAQLNEPFGVAVDASGNLFIADTSNDRVRRVDGATGVITSVAGTGTAGFSGDGGPATDAQLNFPVGVAVDASGNLLIADSDNHRIRRVDSATGVITTVAGTGTPGFSGD